MNDFTFTWFDTKQAEFFLASRNATVTGETANMSDDYVAKFKKNLQNCPVYGEDTIAIIVDSLANIVEVISNK